MQTLAIPNTIHGYFLAPKHISTEGDGSESEAEEETDDDDYDLELGGQNLSSGDSEGISVNRVRLQKTTGRICSVSYCIFFCLKMFVLILQVTSAMLIFTAVLKPFVPSAQFYICSCYTEKNPELMNKWKVWFRYT